MTAERELEECPVCNEHMEVSAGGRVVDCPRCGYHDDDWDVTLDQEREG